MDPSKIETLNGETIEAVNDGTGTTIAPYTGTQPPKTEPEEPLPEVTEYNASHPTWYTKPDDSDESQLQYILDTFNVPNYIMGPWMSSDHRVTKVVQSGQLLADTFTCVGYEVNKHYHAGVNIASSQIKHREFWDEADTRDRFLDESQIATINSESELCRMYEYKTQLRSYQMLTRIGRLPEECIYVDQLLTRLFGPEKAQYTRLVGSHLCVYGPGDFSSVRPDRPYPLECPPNEKLIGQVIIFSKADFKGGKYKFPEIYRQLKPDTSSIRDSWEVYIGFMYVQDGTDYNVLPLKSGKRLDFVYNVYQRTDFGLPTFIPKEATPAPKRSPRPVQRGSYNWPTPEIMMERLVPANYDDVVAELWRQFADKRNLLLPEKAFFYPISTPLIDGASRSIPIFYENIPRKNQPMRVYRSIDTTKRCCFQHMVAGNEDELFAENYIFPPGRNYVSKTEWFFSRETCSNKKTTDAQKITYYLGYLLTLDSSPHSLKPIAPPSSLKRKISETETSDENHTKLRCPKQVSP